MFRNLTEKETERKKYFEKLASQQTYKKALIDVFETKFHLAMQNPVNKIISFDNIPRGLLHNGNLGSLSQYFNENGEHIFGKTVQELNITNVCLKGYNYGIEHQMPDGTEYIAELIKKNPNIETINLSHTQLGDEEAKILLKSLASNTKLLRLKLDGNLISKSYLEEINNVLTEHIKSKIDSDPTLKLKEYLDHSIQPEILSSNNSARLFSFRQRENQINVAAKKSLIDSHLDVMDEIKTSIRRK